MRSHAFALLVLLGGSAPVQGQTAPEYRAPPRPLTWVSDNPFRRYLIRGGDTIPGPVRSISVFRESWRPTAEGFDVIRASVDVGLGDRNDTDTTSVERRGKVLRINGRMDYTEGEWDALLRLPPRPLTVGLEWADTISQRTSGPHAGGLYEARRKYRVARTLGSGDSLRLEIEIEGEIHFNLSTWTDSTRGEYRWFELEGPLQEKFVFAPVSGQLHSRNWSMLLTGIGGDYALGKTDTVPAGLRSQNARYWIPDQRATALMAPLPGTDTAASLSGGTVPVFLHTTGRDSSRLVEGFRRGDGLVAKAEVTLSAGSPTRWTFSWVDLTTNERSATYRAEGGTLITNADRLEPPTPAWGVADADMAGTLIPSLQALSASQPTPFSIYRPTARQWDRVTVSRRSFPDFSVFMLSGEAGGQTALLVNAAGVLLFEEVAPASGERRVRVPASKDRQAELERALTILRRGN